VSISPRRHLHEQLFAGEWFSGVPPERKRAAAVFAISLLAFGSGIAIILFWLFLAL
jgi:hypothetical protein